MLLDKLQKYSSERPTLNCAERMLYSANDEYNMNLSAQTLKTMAGFGGGMNVKSTCGAVTGAIAVISLLFTNTSADDSAKVKELTQEFYKKYEEKMGTTNCEKLKEQYDTDSSKCKYILEPAAEILDEIVNREKDVKK